MKKKAYIDPITDYLLHDDDHISSTGATLRGGATAAGLAAGGGAGYGINNILKNVEKLKGPKSKYGLIGGGALLGGLMGHLYGDENFKRSELDKVKHKLDKIVDRMRSRDAADTGAPKVNSDAVVDQPKNIFKRLVGDDRSKWEIFWDKLKDKINTSTEPIADTLTKWID